MDLVPTPFDNWPARCPAGTGKSVGEGHGTLREPITAGDRTPTVPDRVNQIR